MTMTNIWNSIAHSLASRLRISSSKSKEARRMFETLVTCANEVAKVNPRAVAELVHVILRPMQSEALLAVAERGTDAIDDITVESVFGREFIRCFYATPESMRPRLASTNYRLELGKHVVLPWAWKRDRYVDALALYGSDKGAGRLASGREATGPWRQNGNHRVELWLPWGIGLVGGGNHSIMAGIIAAEGIITPTSVYDFGAVLDQMHTDGVHWYETSSGRLLDRVHDHRIAAVYEIGRLLRQWPSILMRDPAQAPRIPID